ncbi:glutamine synthetase family protein [Arthrobacter sp. FW306-2-2C-D06B]|uniref:glutamine synthetase family protein n=1 Tax=Arthrobacter sp. FW306-2-2C-D06B TaxID=2879618 RepID=UPI001F1D2AC4|nr:glutamine synthetase family protein [Arthrobacter sp. FW306-2-2C-D06B]UKA60509.1 glutamine synthetase family protein [Arthrobacter sp. FW306-2-2C-D06B]
MPIPTLGQLYADSERTARILEIEQELRSAGVKHVYLQYVTLQGRVQAKVVPTEYWVQAASKGMNWAYVVAGGNHMTLDGRTVGSGGAATQEGLMLPDLDTLAILPWDTRIARVFCTHYRRLEEDEAPGEVADDDCRAMLKIALDDLQTDLGIEAASGCEPEMSWFKDADSMDASRSHFPSHVGTSYHVRHLDDVRDVLTKVTEYATALGFTMIQADYEDPGQLEINFQHDNFLATADRLVTFRQICLQVAKELGIIATFMPKPVAGIMANGCHHHVSFWRDGENIMLDPDVFSRRNLNDVGLHAVGGLLAHARGMMALLAPTVNSYKRFLDSNWSPTETNWGYDNRACAFRVVPGRVEVRSPDASTNPYLSHLAILAAVRDGWENKIDPGPAQDGVSRDGTFDFPALPMTLGEALDAFESDEVISSALSPSLRESFVDAKRDEWMRFCGAITSWDFDNYLNYVP